MTSHAYDRAATIAADCAQEAEDAAYREGYNNGGKDAILCLRVMVTGKPYSRAVKSLLTKVLKAFQEEKEG